MVPRLVFLPLYLRADRSVSHIEMTPTHVFFFFGDLPKVVSKRGLCTIMQHEDSLLYPVGSFLEFYSYR